jgi:hypothetical protein
VSTTPGTGDNSAALVDRLGIEQGMVVQEIGYDDDVDADLREAIEDRLNDEMVDVLVDAIAPLADNGVIWLLTPKRGRAGYVEPSDISEAAPTAGLSQTSLLPLGAAWTGARLAQRRSKGSSDKSDRSEKGRNR